MNDFDFWIQLTHTHIHSEQAKQRDKKKTEKNRIIWIFIVWNDKHIIARIMDVCI